MTQAFKKSIALAALFGMLAILPLPVLASAEGLREALDAIDAPLAANEPARAAHQEAVNAELAPAADGANKEIPEIKLYYSEPIGAGEKVFHLTSCKKEEVMAPMRCNAENGAQGKDFAKQCSPKNKLVEGTLIRGCIKDARKELAPSEQVEVPDAKDFDPAKSSCKDDTEKIGYLYAKEWAIVSKNDNEGMEWMYIYRGAIASKDSPSQELVKKVLGDDPKPEDNIAVLQSWRPSLCVSWDVVGDKSSDKVEPASGEMSANVKAFFDSAQATGKKLIDAGCNNDNTAPIEGYIGADLVSTHFNSKPTFTCSVQERITGRTGAELFGRYISAIYRWAASVVGIVGVLVMVYSGIEISMAGGDSGKIDEGKKRIMQSLIGIAILFLSGLILYTINPGFFTG